MWNDKEKTCHKGAHITDLKKLIKKEEEDIIKNR